MTEPMRRPFLRLVASYLFVVALVGVSCELLSRCG